MISIENRKLGDEYSNSKNREYAGNNLLLQVKEIKNEKKGNILYIN